MKHVNLAIAFVVVDVVIVKCDSEFVSYRTLRGGNRIGNTSVYSTLNECLPSLLNLLLVI